MGMGIFTPGSDASPGTTIVGGQPDGQRREGLQAVPVGLEQILFAAATEQSFREELLDDREGAVARRGFKLVETERSILAAAPKGQLETMISRIDTSRSNLQRRDFMRAVAATLVTLAAGTTLSACSKADEAAQQGTQGGPPFKGPTDPSNVPDPANMTTGGGARPDFPEPVPTMAGAVKDTPPDASVDESAGKVEVQSPPPNVKGGARPDLPEPKPTTVPIKTEKRPTRGHTLR